MRQYPFKIQNVAKIAIVVVVTTVFNGGIEGANCRMCGKCCKCGGEVWLLAPYKAQLSEMSSQSSVPAVTISESVREGLGSATYGPTLMPMNIVQQVRRDGVTFWKNIL